VSRRNELSGIWAYESINIMCVCISPLFAYTTARAFWNKNENISVTMKITPCAHPGPRTVQRTTMKRHFVKMCIQDLTWRLLIADTLNDNK